MSPELASWFRLGRSKRLVPPRIPWRADGASRPRVLLECAPEHSPGIVASVLERSGMDVVVCQGPVGHERCPLAAGDGCSAVGGVDVVVNMLGSSTPEQREVLPAVVRLGSPPVVAMTDQRAPAAEGLRTVSWRATGGQLADAIFDAVDDRQ